MTRWHKLALVILLCFPCAVPSSLHAQAWSGIIAPGRAIDWAKAGVTGGIPLDSSIPQCGATIAPTGLVGWKANTVYAVNQKISDPDGNTEIVSAITGAGESGATAPAWPLTASATASDNQVTWKLLLSGTPAAWAANTAYAVGAQITDSNGNVETAIVAGKSGTGAPNWGSSAPYVVTEGPTGSPAPYLTWYLGSAGTDTSAIDAALVSCDGNMRGSAAIQAVSLAAGDFYTSGIVFPGFAADEVLRGAGPDKTDLMVMKTVGCVEASAICLRGNGTSFGYFGTGAGSAPWTGDNGNANSYAKGDSIIDVGAIDGSTPCSTDNQFCVGQAVILDQRDDGVGVLPGSPTPAVAATGAGSTTYTYVVQATIQNGLPYCSTSGGCPAAPGNQVSVTNAATLSASNYNTISFYGSAYDTSCAVYRIAPAPVVLVGTKPCGDNGGYSVTDQGGTQTSASPATATVVGASESGTTATITTTIPHNFKVGDTVGVAEIGGGYATGGFNGIYKVTAILTTATKNASCTQAAGAFDNEVECADPKSLEFQYTVGVGGTTDNPAYNITSASCSGGTETITIAGGADQIVVGDTITVAGSNSASFPITNAPTINGITFSTTCPFSVTNPATVSYVRSGIPASGFANAGENDGGWVGEDTGGVFQSRGANVFINSNHSGIGRGCPDNGDSLCASGEISSRMQSEMKTITAVNGSQLTISPGIYMTNWRAGNAPGMWWGGGRNIVTGNLTELATNDGIENLTFDVSQDGGGGSEGSITLFNTANSWIRNVRGLDGGGMMILVENSDHDSIVDSYFFGSKHCQEESYGIDSIGGADLLIQNNIFQHISPGLMIESDAGSVVAYNYAVDNCYDFVTWLNPSVYGNHGSAGYELFEGNDANGFGADNIHGMADFQTLFRNRLQGNDTPVRSQALFPVNLASYQRADNVIGNILGTLPWQASGDYQSTVNQNTVGYSYSLGVYAAEGTADGVPNDPIVADTLLRWGNYDTATGAVRWCGTSADTGYGTTCASTSEIPTTNSYAFIGANPAPTVGDTGAGQPGLPASFYLSSQPAFWKTSAGTPPWPAIGPDVTGGNAPDGVGGYSYEIPAQLYYGAASIDPHPSPAFAPNQESLTVTNASYSSSNQTATITINSAAAANPLAKADTVTISGISLAGYNGVYELIGVGGSTGAWTFSYLVQTKPPTSSGATAGTVTWPNILLFNGETAYPQDYPGAQPAPQATVIGNGGSHAAGAGGSSIH